MDYALEPFLLMPPGPLYLVLILVLVDYALELKSLIHPLYSTIVLILVLVDYALEPFSICAITPTPEGF